MAGFEDLSDDILYLVLGFLTTERVSALRYLRCTSRRLSLFAGSELYRTVIFEEDNDAQEQASFRCIERILDPTDTLRHHVRFLHVKSFKGDLESSCMNTSLLQECLERIHKLDSFSWDAEVALPSRLLDTLHRRHPGAQLCVSLRQLKQDVITSSQLHNLSISIPCSDITSPNSSVPFERLRDVLIQNHSIRIFSIDAHLDCNLRDAELEKLRPLQQAILVSYATDPPRNLPQRSLIKSMRQETSIPAIYTVQLPVETTDQLPKLEELAFKARTYAFDENHCLCLQRSIDWSKLKRLTLNCSNYGSFFDIFAYEMLQLEYLNVSCQTSRDPWRHHRPHTDSFSQFVSSLHKLKALVLRYNDNDVCDDFWPNLVGTHGDRLVHLSLKRYWTPWADRFCQDKLWSYLSSFTSLKVLELDMPNSPFSQRISCLHCYKDCSLGAMPFIPSLEQLNVCIRVSSNNEQSLRIQYTNHAHSVLEKYWCLYAAQIGSCNLSSFKIKFWRWKIPSPHQIVARIYDNKGSSEITFESMRRNHQLVIQARDDRKVTTTYYNEIRGKDKESRLKVSYVATHQDQRERHRD